MIRPISQRSKGRLKSERTMLRTGSQKDVKLCELTDSWTNAQMDRRADLSTSDTHDVGISKLLSLSENGIAKESTYKNDLMIKEK